MKKFLLSILTVTLFVTFAPTPANAANEAPATTVTVPKPPESEVAETLLSRLDEIKAMDKSNMSAAEKRHLRKETRSIKSQLKQISGGVYLSTGAIILIIVLLIILL